MEDAMQGKQSKSGRDASSKDSLKQEVLVVVGAIDAAALVVDMDGVGVEVWNDDA